MMLPLLVVIAILILWAISIYNHLRTLQARIKGSIQEIGNQLRRQADLLPNVEVFIKKNFSHEKEIFDMLTKARSTVEAAKDSQDLKKIDEAQAALGKSINGFNVIVESNPQMQAIGENRQLFQEIRDTYDKLMYARRTLIDLSIDFNTALVTIPTVWMASAMGFKEEKGFETPTEGEHLKLSTEELKTPPKINLE
jgi:LemA protein